MTESNSVDKSSVNQSRRRFLTGTTAVVGAAGAAALAVPFVKSWLPSAKAKVVGAPVEFNLGPLEPGQLLTGSWRGQPIGILRRTEGMLATLDQVTGDLKDPESTNIDQQPMYAQNEARAINDEYLVLVMTCTHLGCVPQLIAEVGPQPFDQDWKGGFYCPCHKSRFDLSGRVYAGVPAPSNLKIPPYRYIDHQTLLVGADPIDAA